jgi:hypothetical protein
MISASEANKIREAAIKDKQKVMAVLEFIDGKIRDCASKGGDSIRINLNQLSNLNDWQQNELFNELKEYGFTITGAYDIMEHGINGYTISWKEA